MATKNYAAKVTIGGAIESSFKTAFGSATDAVKTLGKEVKNLARQRADIRAFGESKKKIDEFKSSLNEAKKALEEARKKLAAAEKPTAALTRAVDQAERKVKGLERSLESEAGALAKLTLKLNQAGLKTGNLAEQDRKLEARIKSVTQAIRRQEAATARLDSARGKLGSWVGAGVAVGATAAAFVPAVKAAGDFADAMSDVGKFVDDANTPEKLAEIGQAIRDIGRNSPLGAKGVASLVADAGKLGMLSKDALAFAQASEVLAIGLDMSAEEAGSLITKIKTGMGLAIPDVVKLGDAVNFLADKTAASGSGIVEILQRQGGTLKATTKLTAEQIAALAAAFEPVSPNAETAATAMKNFAKALTIGDAATKSQAAAFGKIGLDPKAIAAEMQTNGLGAIEKVLAAVRKVPDAERGAILTRLFGDESKGPIAALVANANNVSDAFAMVADKQQYLGRSQTEYQRELEKFGAQWKITKNQTADLGVEIGSALLPHVHDLFKTIGKGVSAVSRWAKENPKLFKGIIVGTAAVVALAGAVVGVGIAISAVMVAWSGLSAAWAGLGVIAAAAGVPLAGLIGIFAGVGAVVGAVALTIRKYWEPISAFFSGVWEGIKSGWEAGGGSALWATVSAAFDTAKKAISDFLEPVKLTPEQFGKIFASGESFGEFIGGAIPRAIELGKAAFIGLENVVETLKTAFVVSFEAIKAIVTSVMDFVIEKLTWVGDTVGGLIEKLKNVGDALPEWMGGAGGAAPAIPKETSFVPPAMRGAGDRPINVNVNAAPGQSEEAVASAVIRKLRAENDLMGRGSLNDAAFA